MARALATLEDLSDCYERIGRLASAWSGFRDASIAAFVEGHPERAHRSSRRAEALGARLPRLRIEVPPGAEAPAWEVRRNGVLVSRMLWGADVPVNPGGHELRVSAAGREVWIASVDVKQEGRTVTVRVPSDAPNIGGRGATKAIAGTTAAFSMDGAAVEDARAAWFYRGRSGVETQWAKVRASLLDALRVHREPWISAEVGRTDLMLGDYRKAAEHLVSFKKEAAPGAASMESLRAEFLLDAALRKVGTLILGTNVSDAAVFVDGDFMGNTPLRLPIYIAPGERAIEIRRGGYTSVRMRIKVAPGETYSRSFELAKNLFTKPSTRQEVAIVQAGETNKVFIGGSTLTAMLLVNGITMSILSTIDADARDKFDEGSEFESKYKFEKYESRRVVLAGTAFWSFLGAGAVSAGTVAYAVFVSKPISVAGVQAVPLVTDRGGGLQIISAW